VLEEGTQIKVRTTTTISTKRARPGDAFRAVLEEPLMVGNVVVAERGAVVDGVVANSDKGGRIKHRALLELRLTSLQTTKGVVPITTNERARQARGTKKRDGVLIGLGAGVGTVIGALAGGGKGAAIGAGSGGGAGAVTQILTKGTIKVPVETILTFRLDQPLRVRASR